MNLSLAIASLLILIGLLLNFFSAQNQWLFVAINSFLPISSLWIAVTTLGDGAIAGCIFYVVFRTRSDLLAKGLVGGVVALIASQGLKKLLAIPRPEHTEGFNDNLYLLTESMEVTNFSMPSGHTITAFLLGGFLFQYLKLTAAAKALLVIGLVAIAVSRVALGVHWPADVLVGAGLGMLIAVFCIALPTGIKNNWGVLAVHLLYSSFVVALIYKYFF